MTTTTKKSKDNLLEEIDQLADDLIEEEGINIWAIIALRDGVKKLIIAERERILTALAEARERDSHDGFLYYHSDYDRVVNIVTGKEGDSEQE